MAQPANVIGIIGGSGLYEIEGLRGVERRAVSTPFGAPSDEYLIGEFQGRKLVFLPRHGRGHRLLPSELNYRANVHGFLQLGAKWLISISAVGSMREELAPGQMVIADQFFDRTRGRASTFFGDGVVSHVPFADPVCPALAQTLYDAAKARGYVVQMGGTYICIDGPQFSTRAESRIYRSWGVDVIGMTNIPEAKLAREAGLCYATVALVTDYDCWHEEQDDVSVEGVLETMRNNAANAKALISDVVVKLDAQPDCEHRDVARRGVMTAKEAIDPQARRRLSLILGEDDL